MKKTLFFLLTCYSLSVNAQPCTTIDASGCECLDNTQTDCDLLPDIQASWYGLLNIDNGPTEYPQSGAGSNNGRLRISVSTPNTGVGPLTVRGVDENGDRWFLCDGDTFSVYDPSSSQTFTCPTGVEAKQITLQRIYHKNSDGSMSYYERKAGTMTYHPTHGHNHSDDWGVFTLRVEDPNDPDPRNWPIVSDGAKMGFCLMDYGTCGSSTSSTYYGHCRDDNTQNGGGNVLLQSDFPNYGLGGGNYYCSMTEEGISSGYTDVYGEWLDDQWINIDPSLCNGDYWIVGIIDQNNNYLESNEDNNYTAIPFTLTQQGNSSLSTINVTGNVSLCDGESIELTANYGDSYLWNTGDTLQSIIVNQGGTYSVTVENINCPGSVQSSPTIVNIVSVPDPPSVTVNPNPLFPGDIAEIISDGFNNKWYDDNNNLIFIGDTLYTSSLTDDITLYVTQTEIINESSYTGMNNHQGSDYSGDSYNSYLVFNALQDFTLNSVEVFTDSSYAGYRIIELRNSSDIVLKDTAIYIDSDMVIDLMWDIAQGNDYHLGTNTQENVYNFGFENPMLKRSDNGTSYPYTVPDVVEITDSEYGTSYYYYFYNWKVGYSSEGCESESTPIHLDVLVDLEEAIKTNFDLYPNPSSSEVFISFNIENEEDVIITIIDVSGRTVFLEKFNNQIGHLVYDINLNFLKNGTYSLSVITDESLETQTLILQR